MDAPTPLIDREEDDCEDQGFSRIEDGCLRWECQTWEPGATKPTHPELFKNDEGFWTCPKCGGNY